MSQETINYETKINDLKKAMKEILNTHIFVLQSYENPKNLGPILKGIFTRNNIPEIKIKNFIRYLFLDLKSNLEAQGKNFNSNSNLSTMDLTNGNNLLPIIEFFISYVFDINDSNEISNIQQQIISELRPQTFDELSFLLMPPELKEQLVNYTESWLFIQLFMIDAYRAANVLTHILFRMQVIRETESVRRQRQFANLQQNNERGFRHRPKQNLFENPRERYGHNLPENSYSPLPGLESTEANLETEDLNSFNKNEPNRNQAIEQQIKQVELTQDRNELSTLIKMLNDMSDKLSEVFSPQAIKNAINFLKDILKNNNANEIASVLNMIHEFDGIDSNNVVVVHFLYNFFERYPIIMNEKFDFEKMVDFIDNKLFKGDIGYWKLVLKDNFYFSDLKQAVKWNFSVPQYKYLVKIFLSEIEKNSNKTKEIKKQLHVTKILNQNDLKELRNKLIIPGTDYPIGKSLYDLNCEKIAKLNNELWNLKHKNINIILSSEEYNCISDYFEFIVNNKKIEEINYVCTLIGNSPNGIGRILVEVLLQLVPEWIKHQQPMKRRMKQLVKQSREPSMLTKIFESMEPMKQKTESVPPQENPHEHQEEK